MAGGSGQPGDGGPPGGGRLPGCGGGGRAGPSLPPLMPVAYANTPVQSRATDLIDYGTLQGLKLWNLLTEGLTDKFDCKEQH
eukprot:14225345-Ditylum_brightwellii.AAC.1